MLNIYIKNLKGETQRLLEHLNMNKLTYCLDQKRTETFRQPQVAVKRTAVFRNVFFISAYEFVACLDLR